MAAIARQLGGDSAETLAGRFGLLRNNLSHGEHDYPDHELRPWVRTLEIVCRATRFDFSDSILRPLSVALLPWPNSGFRRNPMQYQTKN